MRRSLKLSGMPGLFFLIWQGVSRQSLLANLAIPSMLGERHPCLSTVCEKTLPPTPANIKVKKIAGIAELLLHTVDNYISYRVILYKMNRSL